LSLGKHAGSKESAETRLNPRIWAGIWQSCGENQGGGS
jgi:hypothetical protein